MSNPLNINEVVSNISSVELTKLKGEKYMIEAVMLDGSREVIKKSGNLPQAVQAYSFQINGNAARGSISQYFNFSLSIASYYKDAHLKTFFPVIV
jgi:hypothetical protein